MNGEPYLNGHVSIDDQPVDEMMEILSNIAQKVEAGEIVAIAIAGVYDKDTEDDFCHVFHMPDGYPPPTLLIGALEVLKSSVKKHFY